MKFRVVASRRVSMLDELKLISTEENTTTHLSLYDDTSNETLDYMMSLVKIIRMNYTYAHNKYKDAFTMQMVRDYACVKEATAVLCRYGFIVMVETE